MLGISCHIPEFSGHPVVDLQIIAVITKPVQRARDQTCTSSRFLLHHSFLHCSLIVIVFLSLFMRFPLLDLCVESCFYEPRGTR